MLPVELHHVRLFLHVLGATVWVGGQITLAGLVPGLRALNPDAPRSVARRFNRIAWPAFALLVVTGIWNLVEVEIGETSTRYQASVVVKLVLVAVSALATVAHITARSRAALAAGGAIGALSALAALFIGVQLRG